MNWEAIGAVGEILGATAVVITLYNQGFVDKGIYESYVATIRMFCETEPFGGYWERNRQTFQDEFRGFVDAQAQDVKGTSNVEPN